MASDVIVPSSLFIMTRGDGDSIGSEGGGGDAPEKGAAATDAAGAAAEAPSAEGAKDGDGDAVMKDAEGADPAKEEVGGPTAASAAPRLFQTYGDAPYSDASLASPPTPGGAAICPGPGKWEGHFENLAPTHTGRGRPRGRKRRTGGMENGVREVFYLFFNASPPEGAREVFVETDTTLLANEMLDEKTSTTVEAADGEGDKADAERGGAAEAAPAQEQQPSEPLLPESRVHVRGYGTNQFGTYEIIGSLDPETGALQCQRMYVPVPTPEQIGRAVAGEEASKRYLPGLELATTGLEDDEAEKEKRRGRGAGRKRKSTWKKRESDEVVPIGPDREPLLFPAEVGGAGGEGGGGAAAAPSGTIDIASIVKKRSRLSNEGAAAAPPPVPAGILKPPPQCRADGGGGPMSIGIPPFASGAKPSPSPRGGATPSSGGSGGGKKAKRKRDRKGGGPGSGQQQPPSALKGPAVPPGVVLAARPPPSAVPTLPTAGDPFLARWRAAHYLYYQRVEQEPPEGEGGTGGGGSDAPGGGGHDSRGGAPPPPNPDLIRISYVIYEGEMDNGVRDGRGVCLYNNNTLYEGQWKKNKEHGQGRLMTADRKRIIYEGAWEKGKMHGQGAYFYPKGGGKYVGGFRQNLRNGHGVYSLPDGSIYDGEFRDNNMNGFGIFRWPDGSIYEGSWRDGKRHGTMGVLVASDGFRYEGGWVNGAMEGRGVATYPKGQIYDGTWVNGRREGRGTIRFTNGAVCKWHFVFTFS